MAIIYSEEAIENLDDIYFYLAIERDNPEYAKRYLAALDDTVKQLDLFPLTLFCKRKCPSFNYGEYVNPFSNHCYK